MSPNITLLASLLRREIQEENALPVNVDAILEHCPLSAAEIPLDGLLGLYVPPPAGPGILIKSGQTPGQRRFTIAHELGHFALPKHGAAAQLVCLAADFHAVRTQIEREANQFAADLLMPRLSFGRAIRDRDPTFELVREVAARDRFWVSRTAGAIRTVTLSRESCALVCSQQGRVMWSVRSPNFCYWLDRDRGTPVSPNSVAGSVYRGEAPSEVPEVVPPHAWFDPKGVDVEVLESTFSIPTLDQVLSLIWSIGP